MHDCTPLETYKQGLKLTNFKFEFKSSQQALGTKNIHERGRRLHGRELGGACCFSRESAGILSNLFS